MEKWIPSKCFFPSRLFFFFSNRFYCAAMATCTQLKYTTSDAFKDKLWFCLGITTSLIVAHAYTHTHTHVRTFNVQSNCKLLCRLAQKLLTILFYKYKLSPYMQWAHVACCESSWEKKFLLLILVEYKSLAPALFNLFRKFLSRSFVNSCIHTFIIYLYSIYVT